jgi:hypothetical protein
MAFVKVVEGSEIYNFPIHHLVHFYSKFWSFERSNRTTVARIQAGQRRATPHRACLAVWAACRPRYHAFPRCRMHRGHP